MKTVYTTLQIAGLMLVALAGTSMAQTSAREDYLHDCAECHGPDGKGGGEAKRMLRGYRSVDLTQLSKANDGKFPRHRVYDAIDGSSRVAPHFQGDMPRWAATYRLDEAKQNPEAQQRVQRKISALVDFIETIQEK